LERLAVPLTGRRWQLLSAATEFAQNHLGSATSGNSMRDKILWLLLLGLLLLASRKNQGAITMHRIVAATLLSISSLAGVSGLAYAADLAVNAPTVVPPVPFSWTGFYLGGNVGGGFGTSRKNFIQGTTTSDFNTSGVIGGFTAGYNHQLGSVVAGLEGDISASGVKGDTDCPNQIFTCGTENHWLTTERGRVGYAFDHFMPYVTGGFAAGDVRVFSGLKSTGGSGVDFTRIEPGWTLGGGIEAALTSNWIIKAEYLFVRLDDANVPSNVGTPTTTKFEANIARVGVNYKFNWPPVGF
jgi:outer membrane immunogenic protein